MNTLAINPICLGIPTCSLILQTLKCIWTTNHPQQNKLINYPYAIYAIFRKFISMLMYRTILFRPMCFWTTNHPQQNKQITYPHAIYAIVRSMFFHADVSNALFQANVMDGPVNPLFFLSLSLFFSNHDQTQ